MFAAFATVDSARTCTPNALHTDDALYAAWPHSFWDHARLVRADEEANTFTFIPTSLFPQGYGRNETPFELALINSSEPAPLYVRFAVAADGQVQSFGLFGLIGEVTEREWLGVTAEERAEVWFERVV